MAVRADIEVGGTDQTYNLLAGRDLQRAHGMPQQVVLTVPLLEGLDGVQKTSKSLNNYVAITEPAPEKFGKLMSIPDSLVGRYATLATGLTPAEAEALGGAAHAGGLEGRAGQTRMARAVVRLYHGEDAAAAAEERFDTVFAQRAVPADLAERALDEQDPVPLPELSRRWDSRRAGARLGGWSTTALYGSTLAGCRPAPTTWRGQISLGACWPPAVVRWCASPPVSSLDAGSVLTLGVSVCLVDSERLREYRLHQLRGDPEHRVTFGWPPVVGPPRSESRSTGFPGTTLSGTV